MSTFQRPMMAALNDAFRDQVKRLFSVLANSTEGAKAEAAKQRFAVGLARARAAYDDAQDAIEAATADEE